MLIEAEQFTKTILAEVRYRALYHWLQINATTINKYSFDVPDTKLNEMKIRFPWLFDKEIK